MACIPLSEFEGEKESGYNRIMRWRDKYYRSEQALSIVKSQRDELLMAAKAMSESVALLPAADGRILGLLPILCNLRAAIANAEKPPCA